MDLSFTNFMIFLCLILKCKLWTFFSSDLHIQSFLVPIFLEPFNYFLQYGDVVKQMKAELIKKLSVQINYSYQVIYLQSLSCGDFETSQSRESYFHKFFEQRKCHKFNSRFTFVHLTFKYFDHLQLVKKKGYLLYVMYQCFLLFVFVVYYGRGTACIK